MSESRQQYMPLVESIKRYIEEDNIRLHMPGHKGSEFYRNAYFEDIWKADVTEIPGLDDYHNPQGAIKEAQELLSELFNSEASFFLFNGASAGVHASVISQVNPGDKVLLPRHSHRSLVSAMILSGAIPVYMPSKILNKYNIPLGIDINYLHHNISLVDEVKLVILQNPNYEGIAEEIRNIKELIGDKIIAVDESHGGHFIFHSSLPASGLEADCNIVVHGSHKTLGSLTQTGFIHLRGIDKKRIQETLAVLQSTSPSYLLLSSLDLTRQKLALQGKELYDIIIHKANRLREELNKIKGFHCLEELEIPKRRLDVTKLVISANELNIPGYTLQKILRTEYRIQVEMATGDYVLAMLTPGDVGLDVDKVVTAFKDIATRYCSDFKGTEQIGLPEQPPVRISPREAFFAKKRTVKLEKCRGKICGETISPYPPGIPVICAGEEITPEVIEYLQWLRNSNLLWQGGNDPELKTLAIIA